MSFGSGVCWRRRRFRRGRWQHSQRQPASRHHSAQRRRDTARSLRRVGRSGQHVLPRRSGQRRLRRYDLRHHDRRGQCRERRHTPVSPASLSIQVSISHPDPSTSVPVGHSPRTSRLLEIWFSLGMPQVRPRCTSASSPSANSHEGTDSHGGNNGKFLEHRYDDGRVKQEAASVPRPARLTQARFKRSMRRQVRLHHDAGRPRLGLQGGPRVGSDRGRQPRQRLQQRRHAQRPQGRCNRLGQGS
jgi:hypothetical protein